MTTATEELGKITDEAAWKKIAQLHSSDAVIDERSISLIKRQNPALTEQEFAGLVAEVPGTDSSIPCATNTCCTQSCTRGWCKRSGSQRRGKAERAGLRAKLFLTPGPIPGSASSQPTSTPRSTMAVW